jgi:RNA-directed DNA polymerase
MKRQGSIVPHIADLDNLYLAFYKAKKGKAEKNAILTYAKHLDHNLLSLQEKILCGNFVVGNYFFFTIFDPKKRDICAAPFEQRVLHHAIMNVCHHRFDIAQIDNSYASRKEKGTFAALLKSQRKHL